MESLDFFQNGETPDAYRNLLQELKLHKREFYFTCLAGNSNNLV